MTAVEVIQGALSDLNLRWVTPTESFAPDPRIVYAWIRHLGGDNSQATLFNPGERVMNDTGTVQITLYQAVNTRIWPLIDQIQVTIQSQPVIDDLVIQGVTVAPSTPSRGRTATPININWSKFS